MATLTAISITKSPTKLSVVKLHCRYCIYQIWIRKKNVFNKKDNMSLFAASIFIISVYRSAMLNRWSTLFSAIVKSKI